VFQKKLTQKLENVKYRKILTLFLKIWWGREILGVALLHDEKQFLMVKVEI